MMCSMPRQIKQQRIRDAVSAVPDMLWCHTLRLAINDDPLQTPVLDIVNGGDQRLRDSSRDQYEAKCFDASEQCQREPEQHTDCSQRECLIDATGLLSR